MYPVNIVVFLFLVVFSSFSFSNINTKNFFTSSDDELGKFLGLKVVEVYKKQEVTALDVAEVKEVFSKYNATTNEINAIKAFFLKSIIYQSFLWNEIKSSYVDKKVRFDKKRALQLLTEMMEPLKNRKKVTEVNNRAINQALTYIKAAASRQSFKQNGKLVSLNLEQINSVIATLENKTKFLDQLFLGINEKKPYFLGFRGVKLGSKLGSKLDRFNEHNIIIDEVMPGIKLPGDVIISKPNYPNSNYITFGDIANLTLNGKSRKNKLPCYPLGIVVKKNFITERLDVVFTEKVKSWDKPLPSSYICYDYKNSFDLSYIFIEGKLSSVIYHSEGSKEKVKKLEKTFNMFLKKSS